MPENQTAVLTIISRNYYGMAKTLLQSLKLHQPDWDRYLLLVDEWEGMPKDTNLWVPLTLDELMLPDMKKMLFRYTILELNTAVKPWVLHFLIKKGYKHVVYFDPDICVYRSLVELESALSSNDIVLTPHLTRPLEDDRKPSELDILRSGSYNLGFVAFTSTENTKRCLLWWQSKLEYGAVVDLENGMFNDQKWCELLPSLFENVHILRNPAYNVAYWNLAHRTVEKNDDKYEVNKEPLAFFHYSGLDIEKPHAFSKHQDRFTLGNVSKAVRELVNMYSKAVLANGYAEYIKIPYAFGCFSNEVKIPDACRVIYRNTPSLIKACGENPFECPGIFREEVSCGTKDNKHPILYVMKAVWDVRSDLQAFFPRIFDEDRVAYYQWFMASAKRDMDLPNYFIEQLSTNIELQPLKTKPKRLRSCLYRAAKRLLPRSVKRMIKRCLPVEVLRRIEIKYY